MPFLFGGRLALAEKFLQSGLAEWVAAPGLSFAGG